jgi:hypothetical protein
VTRGGFESRARLSSGTTPGRALSAAGPTAGTATAYLVVVADGSLRLAPVRTGRTLLDVPLARVRARPLGRAGSVVVEVDASPLLLDFADPGAAGESRRQGLGASRLLDKGLGRRRRDRFLRALGSS